jgi:hypothetical protein
MLTSHVPFVANQYIYTFTFQFLTNYHIILFKGTCLATSFARFSLNTIFPLLINKLIFKRGRHDIFFLRLGIRLFRTRVTFVYIDDILECVFFRKISVLQSPNHIFRVVSYTGMIIIL